MPITTISGGIKRGKNGDFITQQVHGAKAPDNADQHHRQRHGRSGKRTKKQPKDNGGKQEEISVNHCISRCRRDVTTVRISGRPLRYISSLCCLPKASVNFSMSFTTLLRPLEFNICLVDANAHQPGIGLLVVQQPAVKRQVVKHLLAAVDFRLG
jgi:hypothetical protein